MVSARPGDVVAASDGGTWQLAPFEVVLPDSGGVRISDEIFRSRPKGHDTAIITNGMGSIFHTMSALRWRLFYSPWARRELGLAQLSSAQCMGSFTQ